MSATNMLITQPSSAPRSVAPSSVPRRRHGVRVVPTHDVPRRHNLWRRAVLPRRHRLWRRAKGPKMLLKFFRVQTCSFFRKMVKIQKIRPPTLGGKWTKYYSIENNHTFVWKLTGNKIPTDSKSNMPEYWSPCVVYPRAGVRRHKPESNGYPFMDTKIIFMIANLIDPLYYT
jgi:hypothetical protein